MVLVLSNFSQKNKVIVYRNISLDAVIFDIAILNAGKTVLKEEEQMTNVISRVTLLAAIMGFISGAFVASSNMGTVAKEIALNGDVRASIDKLP